MFKGMTMGYYCIYCDVDSNGIHERLCPLYTDRMPVDNCNCGECVAKRRGTALMNEQQGIEIHLSDDEWEQGVQEEILWSERRKDRRQAEHNRYVTEALLILDAGHGA